MAKSAPAAPRSRPENSASLVSQFIGASGHPSNLSVELIESASTTLPKTYMAPPSIVNEMHLVAPKGPPSATSVVDTTRFSQAAGYVFTSCMYDETRCRSLNCKLRRHREEEEGYVDD
jgi:hypothetical protein